VVIENLGVVGIPVLEAKARAPLMVDPDAPGSLPIASQGLQPVPWRHPQILYATGDIEHLELSLGCGLDGTERLTGRPWYSVSVSLQRNDRIIRQAYNPIR
jgi:hypothetical protein